MSYESLEACLLDLEKEGQLVRIKEEVDPDLEMAAIQYRLYEIGGPAVLFERVKGSPFRAACNIFGTLDRSKFIFRNTLEKVQRVIDMRNDPANALKSPFKNFVPALAAINALPLKNPAKKPVLFHEINISDLPQIKHWPMDGGAFITLPQVYTENADKPGIMNSNLGMYRIQISGNEYVADKEVGLHYQIHRGIGVHQAKANAKNQPLKVSVFIGGPPAHTIAAVMPLPEGMSELTFAGLLAGRRFRYSYEDGYAVSSDADFVITGEIHPYDVKPEGPFGDHLGYYSLAHPFPVMRVHKVYARQNAIWPFTVVGRPPQEDTSFGDLIHEITGSSIKKEIPGVKAVHAVDAAGVHPLLLAIGSERYTPFVKEMEPMELLTQANRILGTGQLSLAKFLFIAADDPLLEGTGNVELFFKHILERIDFERDIHFQTNTTIDTLDYSGTNLNKGSKVIFAAAGEKKRELIRALPERLSAMGGRLIMDGVVAISVSSFRDQQYAAEQFAWLEKELSGMELRGIALIVATEDASFMDRNLKNFLWATFTRTNPSHDIYGINSFYEHKHWGAKGPLILDARIKPHHAPPLVQDANILSRADKILANAGIGIVK